MTKPDSIVATMCYRSGEIILGGDCEIGRREALPDGIHLALGMLPDRSRGGVRLTHEEVLWLRKALETYPMVP